MAKRFFVNFTLEAGARTLQGAEAHHLTRVLRMGAGDSVLLFDGRGTEAEATILEVADGSAVLSVNAPRPATSESDLHLVLAVAVPKGDRFGWLVEKATELGV
ncbi:MAG: RsmE family RNA methyltransferase, partial [Planctomycetes bacterium]|nr:RsmE family RNA methyltransferase [Planctomycetota bacterium]